MSVLRGLAAAAFVAGLTFANGANAATVTNTSGDVLTNTGDGFKPLTGSAELPAGTQVMVKPGGSATIDYNFGNCIVRIGAGRIWSVQTGAPCKPGTNLIDAGPKTGTGAAPSATSSLLTPEVLGIGALVAGGGALLAVQLTNSKSNPSSP